MFAIHWPRLPLPSFGRSPLPADVQAPTTATPTPTPTPRRDADSAPCDAMLCSHALARGERVLLTDPRVDATGRSYQAPAEGMIAGDPRNLMLASAVAAWVQHGVEGIQEHVECPIGLEPVRRAFIAPDGETYEREHIERWLCEHSTYPLSNKPLPAGDELLRPNEAVSQLSAFLRGESWRGEDRFDIEPVRVPVRQPPPHHAVPILPSVATMDRPDLMARVRSMAILHSFNGPLVAANLGWHVGGGAVFGLGTWLAFNGSDRGWVAIFAPFTAVLSGVAFFATHQRTMGGRHEDSF